MHKILDYLGIINKFIAKEGKQEKKTMRNRSNFPKINLTKNIIAGVSLKKMLSKRSTPIVIVLRKILEKQYNSLKSALERYYPNFDIAYSFKTNNIAGVCRVFKELGAKAEVVSGYEYFLAGKVGYKGSGTIFNGPYKKTDELRKALNDGAFVNIDNYEELENILKVSRSFKDTIRVGIRLNSMNWPSRFGFNLESGEAYQVCKKIGEEKKVKLRGLHMHIGYNIDSPDEYRKEARLMGRFAKKLESSCGQGIEYLDLGGGFPAGSKPFGKEDWKLPEIDKYVKAISQVLKREFPLKGPKLILEPGRYLVDDGVFMISRVIAKKEKNGVQEIVVDATLDQIPTVGYREQEVEVLNQNKKKLITKIFGSTCRENDILVKDVTVSKIDSGDLIAFFKIGAYNISWQNQFCFPRPEILIIEKGTKIRCLRRRETFEDLIKLQALN